jgi:1-aminocyclopropane-1-carboxylate deaminase
MEKIDPFDLPSPVETIELGLPLKWMVKRDDLIHPVISGNKYRKLKYIIREVNRQKAKGIITFGGCFSNHIHAVAAYCGLEKLPSIGIIRGENDLNNPTLRYASGQGMKLFFISRTDYRLKKKSEAVRQILEAHPGYYLIPEGGDHPLARPGLAELLDELEHQGGAPDYLALAAGTGASAAALVHELKIRGWTTKVMIFSVVNDPSLPLKITNDAGVTEADFTFLDQYSMGGYAKTNEEYLSFISWFYTKTSIPVDPVYNGKVVYGLMDLIGKGYFKQGTSLLWLHTGGLQGIEGYNYLNKNKREFLPEFDFIAHGDKPGGGDQHVLSK